MGKYRKNLDLHSEYIEREKRLKAMQESLKHKLEVERNKTKINIKSH